MVAVGPVPYPEPPAPPPRPVSCATVGGLDGSGLDTVPLEVLEHCLKLGWVEQTVHLARWLAVLAVFDRREGWGGWGVRSCAHWLSIHCGISPVTAAEHVRVARRLEDLPVLARAFGTGKLSYSKVRAVCRVATADTEADLVELAGDTTASQLERVLRIVERQRRGETISEDEKEQRRTIAHWTDDDGMGHLEVVAHPEEIAVLRAGIDYGREQLYRALRAGGGAGAGSGSGSGSAEADGGGGGSSSVRVSALGRVDSMLWTMRAGLDRLLGDPGYAPPSPYLVMIHAKEGSALVGDDGMVELDGGLRVHPRRLQQLACDSTLRLLLQGRDDDEDCPLDVGRSKRTITDKQRTALLAVYDTCNVDGCHVPARFCEWHHIEFWTSGGATNRANLRPVCRHHHRLIHTAGVRVVIGPAGYIVALRADQTSQLADVAAAATTAGAGALAGTGLSLVGSSAGELDANALVACNLDAGVELDPDADVDGLTAGWAGEPLTPFATDVIVHHLCQQFERAESARAVRSLMAAAGITGVSPPDQPGDRVGAPSRILEGLDTSDDEVGLPGATAEDRPAAAAAGAGDGAPDEDELRRRRGRRRRRRG